MAGLMAWGFLAWHHIYSSWFLLDSGTIAPSPKAFSRSAGCMIVTGTLLTQPATQELLQLNDILQNIQLGEGADRFVWRWTAHGEYTARSAYRALHLGAPVMDGAKLVGRNPAATQALPPPPEIPKSELRRRHPSNAAAP